MLRGVNISAFFFFSQIFGSSYHVNFVWPFNFNTYLFKDICIYRYNVSYNNCYNISTHNQISFIHTIIKFSVAQFFRYILNLSNYQCNSIDEQLKQTILYNFFFVRLSLGGTTNPDTHLGSLPDTDTSLPSES